MADVQCEVLIVGASLGGVAAALRAGAIGAAVCLVEPSGWIGGQMTGQGVCTPDENEYVETVGSTAAYRDFRQRVRAFYRTAYRLSAEGAAMPRFNLGRCWVNGLDGLGLFTDFRHLFCNRSIDISRARRYNTLRTCPGGEMVYA